MALWTPADITTALWLDASDSGTLFDATTGGSAVAADGAVARWEDKSGNARHATQPTEANRPLRKTSVQNSLDVLRFDGLDDHLLHGLVSTSSVSSFVAYKLISLQTGYRGIIAVGENNSNGSMILARIDGFAKWGTFSSGNILANSDATTNPTIKVLLDNSTATGNSLFSDGSSDGTFSGNPVGQPIKHIGGYSSQKTNADIYEIVVVGSIVSTDDRQKTEGYLAHKWGLAGSLPNDHPYKSAAPTTSTIQTRRRRQLGGYGL